MKDNLIEILDITGTPTICYDVDSVDNVCRLYPGQLLTITNKSMQVYQDNPTNLNESDQKYRFVFAKNQQQKQLLLNVQPIKCYLRDHQMNSKIIEINPYHSIRWLRNIIQRQRKIPVTLIVNEKVLSDDSQSLLKYIHENAIIHVIQQRETQKKLSIIFTKQPGNQSIIHKLTEIPTQNKVQSLLFSISYLTKIPIQYLVLVYGGRILDKNKIISQYRILNNGIIYAVDSRKYMKKVSKQQFQDRVQEIKKSKYIYKQLIKKIKQRQSQSKISSKGFINIGNLNIKNKEKSYNQYQKRQQQLQRNIKKQQQQQVNKNIRTPPNTPIQLFNNLNSQGSVNNQLKQGRLITKQADVYQDRYGFVHQHSQQKTLFKNGRTKIVDIDIAQDQQGNIIKIQKDIVNIKKDSQTGNTIKTQTDIIEDNQNQTIVKKNQIIDQQGNIIKQQIQVIKNQSGQKQINKQQRDICREGQKLVQVHTEVYQDSNGQPYKIQIDINQQKQDNQGNITQYTKDIKQQNGVTSVIQRNVTRDKQGNIIQYKTDIIKITQDQQGNIYKHQRNQIDTETRKVIIQRDIVTDSHGDIISKQTNMKVQHADQNNNVVSHQTDVIEEKDGRAFVIEKSTLQDAEGKVIKSESQMFQLNNSDIGQLNQIQIQHQKPAVIQVEGQNEPIIDGGREISIDQRGNLHTHQKQLIEKQGKTTFVDRDTIEDAHGNVIRVQTDIIQIQGDDDGNMHKHKSQIIQKLGSVTMIETDQIMNPDGVMIRKQKDTIEIQGGQDGSVFKHQKDVIQQQGKTKIIQKQIIEDGHGNVIRSKTKITELQEKQDIIEVNQKQQLVQQVKDEELKDNQQIQKQVQIIEDQNGNIIRREQKITEDQSGSPTIIQRCTVENSQGEVIRQKTSVINVVQGQNYQPQIHRHVIDYEETENKVAIQEKISTQYVDGQVIKSEKQIIQIEELQNGNIKKKQTQIIQQNGIKTVHVTNQLEDSSGHLLSKTSDIIQISDNLLQKLQQNDDPQDVRQVERNYNYDQEGNLHLVQSQIKNSQGHQIQIQRSYVSNPQGEIIKTETQIFDVSQRQDGSTKISAVDILQQGNTVEIVQNDCIQDADGNQIRNQTGTMKINQLEGGFKKIVKQNIIQEGGIIFRVQKQKYEDSEGNILQEKIKTTELVERINEVGDTLVLSQDFKRKQQQRRQDQEGNIHFHEKKIIDNQEGKTTIVQTQVIRNPQNQLIQATTDILQMKQLREGILSRHEINIVQKPDKVTLAQINAIQNTQGDRLTGQVQSVVVTQGPNGQIIKKQTGIIVEDYQKTIIEKTIILDSEENVIKTQTIKKRIYTDQNGVEQGRDFEVYNSNQIQIQGLPSTIQKKVEVDLLGNIESMERLTTVKHEGQKQIVEATTVKVTSAEDGTIVDQSMNVTKVVTNQDGQVLISTQDIPIQGNQPVYNQIQSEIRGKEPQQPVEYSKQVVQDSEGNLHTLERQVIHKEGNNTIIKSQTIEDSEGHVIQINTNVLDNQQLEDGKILRHVTDIISSDKVITTETFTIQNADGSLVNEKTRKVQVSQNDGLIKTNRTDIVKENDKITVDNVEILQDQQGNVIDKSSNKLQIQQSQSAVRQHARRVAKAQIQGQVTGIVRQVRQDQLGNIHTIQTQTIQDHGKRIIVDSQTIQNPVGQIIKVQTDILQQQKLQDESIQKHKTIITQQGGQVQVIQYSEIKQDQINLLDLQNQQEVNKVIQIQIKQMGPDDKYVNTEKKYEQDNLLENIPVIFCVNKVQEFDLLGNEAINITGNNNQNKSQQYNLLDNQPVITIQNYRNADQPTYKIQASQSNLLDQSLQNSVKYCELPIDSVRFQTTNFTNTAIEQTAPIQNLSSVQQSHQFSNISSTQQYQKPISQLQQQNSIKSQLFQQQKGKIESSVEEYTITVIDKQLNRLKLSVKANQTIDQVAVTLGSKIGIKQQQNIKFYKDGSELNQNAKLSDLKIGPGTELYYSDITDQQTVK